MKNEMLHSTSRHINDDVMESKASKVMQCDVSTVSESVSSHFSSATTPQCLKILKKSHSTLRATELRLHFEWSKVH